MKDFTVVYMQNNDGPQLAYTDQSNVKILEMDGKKFKNYSGDGFLKKYEDWRLSPDERAIDLAARLTIEEIAGLMLYSGHQAVPADLEWYQGTYGGKTFKDSGAAPDDLTDQQIDFLKESHLRHFLITKVQSPEVSAGWNNNLQRLAESLGAGVPVNISSDPRHSSDSSKEFNFGAGGKISMWPESLGLAATFDPEIARRFGEVASEEYRALGISTALSPQVDLATDPRWYRFSMTFGEDRNLSADMCRAYIDGFQTSRGDQEIADGWGYESVNAMVKHWPGGGTGESGRDAHFAYGKYAVYPGDNFDEHLYPFTEGAFKLDGPTIQVSAIMPYYTISFNQDKNGENVGNSYSRYMIQELLREKYGFNGVVCTDWAITDDEGEDITKILPGVQAIKAIHPDLRVGGPSTSNFVPDDRFDSEREDRSRHTTFTSPNIDEADWRPVWMEAFLDFCNVEGLPVDFVCTHPYPTDWALDGTGTGRNYSRTVDATRRDLERLGEILRNSAYPDAEMHLTEWSSTPSPRDHGHDYLPAAAYIVKVNLDTADLTDSLSYWVFTDVFEESGAGDSIFHGGFGMINFQGIVKPAYHGYRFLNTLGREELARCDKGIVTRHPGSGKLSALLYHYDDQAVPTAVPNAVVREQAEATQALGSKATLQLTLQYLTPGAAFTVETIDEDNGFAIPAWKAMGSPEPPTREQTQVLRSISSAGKKELIYANAEGILDLNLHLSPWSLVSVNEI